MYYLRKKPYKKKYIDHITKETSYIDFNEDRALYKSTYCGRKYRMSYPHGAPRTKLWTCKKLQTALQQRIALFNYSDEWFDIYDLETNEPISQDMYDTYIPTKLDVARTKQTLYYNTREDTLERDKPDDLTDYIVYRKGTKLNVYNFVDYHGIWEARDPFAEHDIADIIILVAKDGNTLMKFNTWEEYALDGSPLIKTSWEITDGENCGEFKF